MSKRLLSPSITVNDCQYGSWLLVHSNHPTKATMLQVPIPAPIQSDVSKSVPLIQSTLLIYLVVAGPNAALGTDSRNGVEIAIDDAGGKILGHDIKFDGEDGGCSCRWWSGSRHQAGC